MSRGGVVGCLVVASVVTAAPPADACTPAISNAPFQLDASQGDTTPPAQPFVRGHWFPPTTDAARCNDGKLVALLVESTDDATPSDRIGYRVEVQIGGRILPSADAVEPRDGELYLPFEPDPENEYDFTILRIFAVDRSGNEGLYNSITIHWRDVETVAPDAGGGCATTFPAGLLFVGLAIALCRRRRVFGLLFGIAACGDGGAEVAETYCNGVFDSQHVIDPAFRGDLTPPSEPIILGHTVTPSTSDDPECEHFVTITLEISATDDTTPTERLGLFAFTGSGLDITSAGSTRYAAAPDGMVHINTSVGFGVGGFQADFFARAVDANGNPSPESAPYHIVWRP